MIIKSLILTIEDKKQVQWEKTNRALKHFFLSKSRHSRGCLLSGFDFIHFHESTRRRDEPNIFRSTLHQ